MRHKTHWVPFVIGMSLMLCGAYLDNIRGILLPQWASHFGYSFTGVFLLLSYFGAAVANLLCIPLTSVFGLWKAARIVLIAGFLLLLLSLAISTRGGILGFSLFFGGLIASLGSLSNFFALAAAESHLAHKGRYVSLLQANYGLGSILAPLVGGFLLSRLWTWSHLVLLPLPFFLLIGMGLFFDNSPNPDAHVERGALRRPSFLDYFLTSAFFSLYVCYEVGISLWMYVYLVDGRHLTPLKASQWVAGFFACMALSRVLAGVSDKTRRRRKIITLSLLASALAFLLSVTSGNGAWLALCGFMGPVYPLFLADVERMFRAQSRGVLLIALASLQVACGLSHLGLSLAARSFGIDKSYSLAGVYCVFAFLTWGVWLKRERFTRFGEPPWDPAVMPGLLATPQKEAQRGWLSRLRQGGTEM